MGTAKSSLEVEQLRAFLVARHQLCLTLRVGEAAIFLRIPGGRKKKDLGYEADRIDNKTVFIIERTHIGIILQSYQGDSW